ncbi:hypothetical protein RND81_08G039000 [Saponaria officinalis]|uniref:Pentatricopeptide repeat-containing protein n=1 Tax=Saponaria officinalis TaxID=3572 RepID=A0AAW1J4E7_SAPOF
MWKSLSYRSSLTRNLGKKLVSLQNPASCSSQFQVFHYKGFNSSSNCNDLLIGVKPRTFFNQNIRFLSHSSSISEFESENHDPVSSSSEGEVENDEIVVDSSKDLEFSNDFDRDDEINGAQMSGICSVDELVGDFDENVGTVENDVGSIDEDLVEGVSSESIDVEKFENVLSLLQSSIDESLETSLDDLELSMNEEFMVKVIETPLVPGEHLIRFFKWASSKKEFAVTTSMVLNSLARVICVTPKRKVAYALWDLVKELGEESGAVTVDLLNQLISVFSEMGKAKAAFEVFEKFDELGCVPNVDTYFLTIGALCKRSFYDWAATVSQKMLDAGILPDSEKVGNIISFYCKGLRSAEAHAVYIAAKEKNMHPPQRAINFLISCLSKVDETTPLAKEMLDDISVEARKHAINPFSWVVRGLCRKNDIEGGKKLLLEMIEKGPPPGNAVFNMVINALSKAGELGEAKEILKLMESRGLKPDVFSYSVIISGYAKGGSMEEACKVLSDARKKHPKLCPATFHSLIRGYCKLEQFDKAVKLLSDMKKYGVEPNVDEYNKLIQSLCLKALDWETSEKLLEEMKSKGMHLPGISRGLISAVKELQQEASGSASEEAVANA